jgi:hypothetical protein
MSVYLWKTNESGKINLNEAKIETGKDSIVLPTQQV